MCGKTHHEASHSWRIAVTTTHDVAMNGTFISSALGEKEITEGRTDRRRLRQKRYTLHEHSSSGITVAELSGATGISLCVKARSSTSLPHKIICVSPKFDGVG